MKQIYFIRHGQSVMNESDLWAGSTDTPLTELGISQAKAAGLHAKNQGLAFDAIISSPKQRAHHTAKHIAQELGHPIQDIIVDPRLTERNFGELEGTPYINTKLAYHADERSIDAYKDVEPLQDLQNRADEFLEYAMSLPHDTILVAGHSAFGRALRRSVDKLPISERGESFDNAVITRLI